MTQGMRHWQELDALKLGTPAQYDLWRASALDEESLLKLARPVLFLAFDGFRKRNPMDVAAIPHPRTAPLGTWACVRPTLPIPIKWETLPLTRDLVTATELATLERLDAAVKLTLAHPWLVGSTGPSGFAVATSPRLHKGTCQRCQCEAAEASALVSVEWAGRTLTREYRL